MPEQLLLFANELRTSAKEILVRAASTDDLEAQEMMRLVAAARQSTAPSKNTFGPQDLR
jgi:hypothetical protein